MRKCIERSFSVILAAAMLTLLCAVVPVYTANAADSGAQVSVDITWNSVQFTYSGGTWNPETHTYENGSWSTDSGNFTVFNNGSTRVTAEFVYTPAKEMSRITGSFSNPKLTVPLSQSAQTKLSLSGAPSTSLENCPIGTVTVTVKSLGGISGGEDEGEWDIPKKGS